MPTTYKVAGMTCGGCVSSVMNAVKKAMPAAKVEVSLDPQTVSIEGEHDPRTVKQAVEDAGFEFVDG